MVVRIHHPDVFESYEYHGNTSIEKTRTDTGGFIRRDWILFDTVEEAQIYFNENCCLMEAV